jgi:hypothetical protein
MLWFLCHCWSRLRFSPVASGFRTCSIKLWQSHVVLVVFHECTSGPVLCCRAIEIFIEFMGVKWNHDFLLQDAIIWTMFISDNMFIFFIKITLCLQRLGTRPRWTERLAEFTQIARYTFVISATNRVGRGIVLSPCFGWFRHATMYAPTDLTRPMVIYFGWQCQLQANEDQLCLIWWT